MSKKASEETGLAVRESKPQQLTRPGTFNPTTFAEAITFADYIAKSDLAPKDYKDKAGNILVALQMGAELGLPPMAALQNIAVINGRPALWGDAALAVVMSHPAYEWHKEWSEGVGVKEVAYCEIKRRGQASHVSSFSVEDAVKAKLWGKTGKEGQPTPWVTYPGRMLKMRARGFALRDKFADALRGLQIAEEAQDMPPIQGEPDAVEKKTAKREREVATLEPSKEANRGHGDEGLRQQEAKPASTDIKTESDTTARTEDSSAVDEGRKEPEGFTHITGTVTKIEPKMSTITAAQKSKAKKAGDPEPNPRPFFIVTVKTSENLVDDQGIPIVPGVTLDVPVYVWHVSLHEYVVKSINKPVEFGLERTVKSEGEENEKVFYSLEEIYKIGDVNFVANKPSAAPSAEQLGFSE